MAHLPDVLNAFEGGGTITKDHAVRWLTDSSLEIAGAAHAYLEKPQHASRVAPPMTEDEFAELSLHYLERCLVGSQEGEWIQTRYEAAWALVSWLGRHAKRDSDQVHAFVQWLGDVYKTRPDIRTVVVTGFLEHAIGSKGANRLFASWQRDPELAEALKSAREWKSSGGESPIDLN